MYVWHSTSSDVASAARGMSLKDSEGSSPVKTKLSSFFEPENVERCSLRNGKIFKDFTVQSSEILINTKVGSNEFEIDTGYFLSKEDSSKLSLKINEENLKNVSNPKKSGGSTSRLLISSLYKKPCSCC